MVVEWVVFIIKFCRFGYGFRYFVFVCLGFMGVIVLFIIIWVGCVVWYRIVGVFVYRDFRRESNYFV